MTNVNIFSTCGDGSDSKYVCLINSAILLTRIVCRSGLGAAW